MARKISNAPGIVNTIVKATNAVCEPQLPFVDKSTFSDFGKQLSMAPVEVQNTFIDNLISLCGMQIILGKRMFTSIFKKLYREDTLTENVALYMIDAIRARSYSSEETNRILETNPPRVGVQYITSVLRRQYAISEIEDLLTGAFTSEGSFLSFLDAISTQLYSSYEDDVNESIKTLINENIKEGNIRLEPVTKPTNQSTLLAFMQILKQIGSDWGVERSRIYNMAGFRTYSPEDDHYVLLNSQLASMNEVYNLAWSFNKSFLEMKSEGSAIVMASSALCDGNVYAMLFDKDLFQIRNRVNHPRLTSFFNPATLSQNRFLTCFTVLSLAFFANACAFIDPSKIGYDATTPATLATRNGSDHANLGEVVEMYVKAIKADTGKYADKFGKWSVSGNTSTDTYIDEDSGELFIAADEAGTTSSGDQVLTVTWTSHLDSNVTATYTITLNV